MNEELDPNDPFIRSLGDRLRSAADGVDGAGVTREGIDARSASVPATAPSRVRVRAAMAVAAALVVVGGVAAALAGGGSGSEPLRVGSSDDPTTVPAEPATTTVVCDQDRVLGSTHLTAAQVAALQAAGLIDDLGADGGPDEAYEINLRVARRLEAQGVGLTVAQRDDAAIDMEALAADPCVGVVRDEGPATTLPDDPSQVPTAPPTTAPPTTAPPTTAPSADDPVTTTSIGEPPAPAIGAEVGRLHIEAIGLDVAVLEGVGVGQLGEGVGHDPRSASPGGLGNVVISGHRTDEPAPFLDLDRLRPGDEVVLDTTHGTATYRVLGTEIVAPDRVDVLDDHGDDRLTLIAEHPKHSASERIVVTASLVDLAPR